MGIFSVNEQKQTSNMFILPYAHNLEQKFTIHFSLNMQTGINNITLLIPLVYNCNPQQFEQTVAIPATTGL